MQLDNFEIIDSIAIQYKECYLDLHNNFDFINLNYDLLNKRVELHWRKSVGEWANNEKHENLKLIFDFLSVFKVNQRDKEMPFSEDYCLSYIGYLHPDDIDLMEGFLSPENSETNYHLVLGFESGTVIKLYAELIRIEVF